MGREFRQHREDARSAGCSAGGGEGGAGHREPRAQRQKPRETSDRPWQQAGKGAFVAFRAQLPQGRRQGRESATQLKTGTRAAGDKDGGCVVDDLMTRLGSQRRTENRTVARAGGSGRRRPPLFRFAGREGRAGGEGRVKGKLLLVTAAPGIHPALASAQRRLLCRCEPYELRSHPATPPRLKPRTPLSFPKLVVRGMGSSRPLKLLLKT